MSGSKEDLGAQAQKMAQIEAALQKRLTAARGELDAVEAAADAEDKRKALYSEILSLRERLEAAQFELAFLKQRLSSAESGQEVREFETRIFARV